MTPSRVCAGCGADLTPPDVICPACTRTVRLDLLDIPALLGLLDDATAGLDRIDRPGGPADVDPDQALPLTAATTRLPFNPATGDAARHLVMTAALWAADTYARHPLTSRPPVDQHAAPWLAARTHLLATHPEAATARAEVRAAIGRARTLVDRPGESWWAGYCDAPVDDPAVPGTVVACGWQLRAAAGAEAVVCRGCGTRHDLAERRARMLDQAADRLLTATQAARALSGVDYQLPAATVRKWKFRGQLEQRGEDDAGQPLYRLGDVTALANRARYGATDTTGRSA